MIALESLATQFQLRLEQLLAAVSVCIVANGWDTRKLVFYIAEPHSEKAITSTADLTFISCSSVSILFFNVFHPCLDT